MHLVKLVLEITWFNKIENGWRKLRPSTNLSTNNSTALQLSRIARKKKLHIYPEKTHSSNNSTFNQTQHNYTKTAHFSKNSTFLQKTAHFSKNRTFLQKQHIFPITAYCNTFSQHLDPKSTVICLAVFFLLSEDICIRDF